MKDVAAIVVCLTVGSMSFLSGCSSRVWCGDESRYRIVAIIFGLVGISMGVLALLGYIEIRE